ncbi:MAG: four helix bundle protein [Verrucomicrobiota bacterium]
MRSIFDCSIVQPVPFLFENLDVYQKAVDFAEKASDLTTHFPKGNYYLSDQLNRASLSIATNIAEGNGRYHKADRINFFRIARGSTFECVPILELCLRKKLIDKAKHQTLKENLDEICKMLTGLMNY